MPLGTLGRFAVAKHIHDKRKDDDSSSSDDEKRGLGPVGKIAAVGAVHHHREERDRELGPVGKVAAVGAIHHHRKEKEEEEKMKRQQVGLY